MEHVPRGAMPSEADIAQMAKDLADWVDDDAARRAYREVMGSDMPGEPKPFPLSIRQAQARFTPEVFPAPLRDALTDYYMRPAAEDLARRVRTGQPLPAGLTLDGYEPGPRCGQILPDACGGVCLRKLGHDGACSRKPYGPADLHRC